MFIGVSVSMRYLLPGKFTLNPLNDLPDFFCTRNVFVFLFDGMLVCLLLLARFVLIIMFMSHNYWLVG